MTATERELALARDLLDSDFRMVQRDGLVAVRAEGVVWMLGFEALAADDGFESVSVEATTLWRRPVEEVRAASDAGAPGGRRGDS